jgi:ribosomal protein S18 acetylase RimI-like enzyme
MIIRKALKDDSESISHLFMLASGEVICKFIGEQNPTKAQDFLYHFVNSEQNQYSYTNCYVAVEKDVIIGAILVYDGERLQELRKPVLDHIHANLYPELYIEDETHAGEYYIASIGVSPLQEGKGVGSKLLQLVIQEKVISEGQTLGLLVDKRNPSAKKLYLRLGFKPVGEKTVLGLSLVHLQMTAYSFEE